MNKRVLSVFGFIMVFAVFFFSSGCPNFQNQYAIDALPGCDDCPTVLDKDILSELINKIENGDYGKINSIVIIHNDSLAFEEYFMGWTRHMLHFCASATKSFISVLIGIAIDQGKITGVDEKLLGFFPEYDDIANINERKESITLEHVLTMSSGFTWTPLDSAEVMAETNDWIRYVLDLPMSDDPGTRFVYNSGGSHLLSGIITNITGQSAETFAEENLFSKIGIYNWKWESDPNGINTGGWGLNLHPVDMAMFGYLYLKNGLLNDEQIISKDWVKESTSSHMSLYGYQWWVWPDDMLEGHLEARGMYYATGGGGQFIFIIPNLNMVVVSTGENLDEYGNAGYDMLFDYILPAVKDK